MIYIDNENFSLENETVVTIGNFDGFHIGHMDLINETLEISKYENIKSVLFTFFPHPKKVMANIESNTIYSLDEKLFFAKDFGIDIFLNFPFTKEFSKTKPLEFMHTILKNKLKCKYLVIGEDYTFGQNKSGNIEILNNLSIELDMEIFVIPHRMYTHNCVTKKVSSTDILKFIEDENFCMVNKLLNREYKKNL